MMKSRSVSATAVALAAIFVCTLALPLQEAEQERTSADHPVSGFEGQKIRNLDPLGGGNTVRHARDVHRFEFIPYLSARRYDFSPFLRQMQQQRTTERMPVRDYDVPKRNFDEIDRTGIDNFFGNKFTKRNFDEIDRTSFDRFMRRVMEESIYNNQY